MIEIVTANNDTCTVENNTAENNAVDAEPTSGRRILSIDALRGFVMFWIIGGGTLVIGAATFCCDPLPDWFAYHTNHPAWIGFSAWDLIMPLFLFVVGVVIPFSFTKRLEMGQSKASIQLKIYRRVLILFVLGIIAQGSLLTYDLDKIHIYCNTLQAIAAGYLIAGLAFLYLPLIVQIALAAGLMLSYWALIMFVPVPGHGAGILEPNVNLALYIDKIILRGFRDGTTYTWILSSMTFAATVLLGMFAGCVLLAKKSGRFNKLFWLVVLGLVCLGLGWAWSLDSPLRFPIIKHIWTSSMVLWAAGWSYLLLAAFYLAFDVWGFRKCAFPMVVIGANAIAVYMAVHVFDFRKIGDIFVGGLVPHLGNYAPGVRALAAFIVVWLILLFLYRKKTFIRV